MKRVILITTIALASLSGCQSGYEDWLMKHPEQEELSKRPIKPVPQEIPITRPDLPPERDEWREVTEGVYNFSWKLFRQYYQQKQDNVLMAPYTMLSTLNRKLRNKGELAQTQFIKSMNIEEDLIDRVNVYFHSMEDYEDHPELLNEILAAQHKPFIATMLPFALFHLAGISHADYNASLDILSLDYDESRPRIIREDVYYDELGKSVPGL